MLVFALVRAIEIVGEAASKGARRHAKPLETFLGIDRVDA